MVCDEQAKVNVNTVFTQSTLLGRTTASQAVRKLVGHLDEVRHLVHPRPLLRSANKQGQADDQLQPFGSFGQIFVDTAPGLLLGRAQEAGPVDYLTCWGGGKVNLMRAADPVVEQVCNGRVESAADTSIA